MPRLENVFVLLVIFQVANCFPAKIVCSKVARENLRLRSTMCARRESAFGTANNTPILAGNAEFPRRLFVQLCALNTLSGFSIPAVAVEESDEQTSAESSDTKRGYSEKSESENQDASTTGSAMKECDSPPQRTEEKKSEICAADY